jgi:hypothetical protein
LPTKRTILVFAAAAATTLGLASCTKTETVNPTPTTVAPTSSGSTPGSTAPPTTATTGTSAPKPKGTSAPSGSMKPNTHATELPDGSKVEGEMSCSYGNKHLRLILEGFEKSSRVILDLDPKVGAEVDDAEVTVRGETNGNTLATGTARVTSSVYDTTFDGKDAQGLVFSFSARFTAKEGTADDTFTGQGSCIIDGDRLGSDKPVSGGTLTVPVTDASTFAKTLVDIALRDANTKADAFGAPEAWVAEGLPKTALVGYGNEATPETISGFTTVSDKGGSYDAYPFAVSDGSNCAYGVIYTTDKDAKPAGKVIEATGTCTGDAALTEFEKTVLAS